MASTYTTSVIADNKVRSSELQSALDALENAVVDMSNATQLLFERLVPVTSQYAAAAKTQGVTDAPRQAPSCVTIGRIQELTERLYSVRALIGEQHDALVV